MKRFKEDYKQLLNSPESKRFFEHKKRESLLRLRYIFMFFVPYMLMLFIFDFNRHLIANAIGACILMACICIPYIQLRNQRDQKPLD